MKNKRSKNKNKALKSKNRRNLILYLVMATFIILFWINYQSSKVEVLHAQGLDESLEVQALVIKNEEIMTINDNIDFIVDEGNRVSKNQILSQSTGTAAMFNYSTELDIINDLIDNEMYQEENLFNKDIQTIDNSLSEIEDDLNWAQTLNNQDKISQLETEKKELLLKKEKIIESFQYIGLDRDTLIDLKEKYMKQSINKDSMINLQNLNFTFPGYIYYNLDGYEKSLDTNILEYITPEYISNLEQYHSDYQTNAGQIIKVIDNSYIYLTFILPKEEILYQESLALDKKDNILKQLDTKSLNTYYNYLNKRVDLLRSFPKIAIQYNEEKEYGYVIDSRDYGDNKIIIVQLKDRITQNLLESRNISLDVFTYSSKGYYVPQKSIVNKEDKDFIVVLDKGFLKEYVEVTISKKTEDMFFLEKSKNENISDGMQLILNP